MTNAPTTLREFLDRHCGHDRERDAWELCCHHFTQWFGPLGVEVAWPLFWRSRIHWTWGYWR